MGTFGNQPEFATKVDAVVALPLENIKSGAIYVGKILSASSDASITVRPVGNSADVTFSGITSGSFIPVIVSKITSSINIDNSSILIIY